MIYDRRLDRTSSNIYLSVSIGRSRSNSGASTSSAERCDTGVLQSAPVQQPADFTSPARGGQRRPRFQPQSGQIAEASPTARSCASAAMPAPRARKRRPGGRRIRGPAPPDRRVRAAARATAPISKRSPGELPCLPHVVLGVFDAHEDSRAHAEALQRRSTFICLSRIWEIPVTSIQSNPSETRWYTTSPRSSLDVVIAPRFNHRAPESPRPGARAIRRVARRRLAAASRQKDGRNAANVCMPLVPAVLLRGMSASVPAACDGPLRVSLSRWRLPTCGPRTSIARSKKRKDRHGRRLCMEPHSRRRAPGRGIRRRGARARGQPSSRECDHHRHVGKVAPSVVSTLPCGHDHRVPTRRESQRLAQARERRHRRRWRTYVRVRWIAALDRQPSSTSGARRPPPSSRRARSSRTRG